MGKFISVKFLYQREYKFFLLLVNTAKLCPSLDLHKDSLDPQLVPSQSWNRDCAFYISASLVTSGRKQCSVYKIGLINICGNKINYIDVNHHFSPGGKEGNMGSLWKVSGMVIVGLGLICSP
jgi:hypothetical protein